MGEAVESLSRCPSGRVSEQAVAADEALCAKASAQVFLAAAGVAACRVHLGRARPALSPRARLHPILGWANRRVAAFTGIHTR